MAKIYEDNSLSIGNTPLIRINHLAKGFTGTVLAKIEGQNPAYSVKCRIGANMIWDAEKRGVLKPGMEIIEPTSGNTGISLAYVAAARGVQTDPDHARDDEHRTPEDRGRPGRQPDPDPRPRGDEGGDQPRRGDRGLRSAEVLPPQQFKNPANPEIHERTTGPEIWDDTDGAIDVLVSGVGTGGTITGISRYIKNTRGKKILSVAVEPKESPVISQKLAGAEIKPGPHKIQGIGAGFIPDTLDLSIVDRVEQVESGEAIELARRLAKEEGLLAGISCGAAMAAAIRLTKLEEFAGKTIVVIMPDAAERYLSTALFEGI